MNIKKVKIKLMFILFVFSVSTYSQVSINTDGTNPDPSSILDIKSNSKGLLIPRMSSTQRIAIPSPVDGLLVFDQTKGSFWYYDSFGLIWREISKTGLHDKITDNDDNTYITVQKVLNEDTIRYYVGGTEFFKMWNGRLEPMNTGRSVFIGEKAGQHDNLSNNSNVLIGYKAGTNTTSGFNNVAIGYQAIMSNTTGSSNTALGTGALSSNSNGNNNVAVGLDVISHNTIGNANTASGNRAMLSNTSGNNNSAFGFESLSANTIGKQNVAVGIAALHSNTVGDGNVAVGNATLLHNILGNNLTALGDSALFYNGFEASSSQGLYNTAVGSKALLNNHTGVNNTATGNEALMSNVLGDGNTAYGSLSTHSNVTGSNNSAFGAHSLEVNSEGSANTAIGYQSMAFNQLGSSNTVVGQGALHNNMMGSTNTAIGNEAGYLNPGTGNVFIGYQAGYAESASNKLYIANSTTSTPLIWGDFNDQILQINGRLTIRDPYSTNPHGYSFPDTGSIYDNCILKYDSVYNALKWAQNIPDKIADTDRNTRVTTEEHPNEDQVRIITNGQEIAKYSINQVNINRIIKYQKTYYYSIPPSAFSASYITNQYSGLPNWIDPLQRSICTNDSAWARNDNHNEVTIYDGKELSYRTASNPVDQMNFLAPLILPDRAIIDSVGVSYRNIYNYDYAISYKLNEVNLTNGNQITIFCTQTPAINTPGVRTHGTDNIGYSIHNNKNVYNLIVDFSRVQEGVVFYGAIIKYHILEL